MIVNQLKRNFTFVLFTVVLFSACTGTTDIQWNEEEGYQWAEVSPGYFGNTGFTEIEPSQTGIDFTNQASVENIKENRNFLNGSGVALADVDGDGLIDIYFAQLEGSNKLYKNLGGWEFEDITEKANVALEDYHSTGVVFADVNGDTYPDLLTTSLTKRNELFINNGDGTFSKKENSGLSSSQGSNTMALADIDNDGDLDLYISNFKLKSARDIYSAEELSTENTVQKQGDSLVVVPPYDEYYGIIETEGQSYRNEYGTKDDLYINEGDGTFIKADDREYFFTSDGEERGLSRDWGLTAKFHDINNDGYPDLYVANDFWTPDRFWINRGDGTFRMIDRNTIRSMSFASMGVDFSDINRNGHTDFLITEMLSSVHQRRLRQYAEHLDPIDGRPQYNRNSFYFNRGDNTFAEISNYSQLPASEWSWATNFLDIDLDGYEDVIIATGYGYDYQDIDTQIELNKNSMQGRSGGADAVSYPPLPLRNKMYQNNKDLTFDNKSEEWGFKEQDISLGLAIADLDNDGDPDFVTNRFNEQAALYENNTNKDRIAVRLKGSGNNTHAVGAKVKLEGVSDIAQTKEIAAGGSYVSGSDYQVFFAAEEGTNHTLTITWPGNNKISTIDSVKANRIYEIDQSEVPSDNISELERKISEDPLFTDVSDDISHIHHEDPYNDFNVQPLLPFKVSQLGPGVAWVDYDGDTDDDLLIGSGKGDGLALLQNEGNGEFNRVSNNPITETASGDQTSIISWKESDTVHLVVGSSNFEQGDPNVPSTFHYELQDGEVIGESTIPGILSTTGPLAAADYNGDGTIDLFVGGRFNPGRYPEDASSRLFANNNGDFQLDKRNSQKLLVFGLVTGAVFTDYDGDSDPDLLISREWDSLVLFENRDGVFHDVSAEVGLESYKGWWNGVATGDFNNDGRPDFIATNIGQNSAYQLKDSNPLKLFYEDFNNNGKLNIVDAYYEETLGGYVPRRKLYELNSIPSVLQYVNSHEEYAQSSVDQIFGKNFDIVSSKEISTIKHMLFINSENGFEAHPLPVEAQLSAAFHPAIADFDNDGNEDVFLSQNLFTFPGTIPRIDAGRGLLLKGDGTGNLKPVPGQVSGIKAYEDQRGAAVGDFNMDGKIDLVVGQNEDKTKLYQNNQSKSGLRVKLVGPPENTSAVGSKVRVIYSDNTKGPLRELQAGSGYWSQSSYTQVLGYAKDVKELEIQWYDGRSSTVEVNPDKREQTITYSKLF
ncbi:CRTAC1 family protein [Aliifodinibius salicampi]|uniref:CRTAC1 family protein n=1 Tax=Fodinibius salicampi TaxID=1920655 RepID=A0ABT3PVL5_9BACT|nr:CRTAC1 family protein [Fodinibius salicampi]MCW9711885.1 CRTAC1 family protein [Fodinibius salicampi]